MEKRIVVIGAGIGGLTTASILARAGFQVTLLEAHIYPGGCAGTFFHKKYRFDAGATLAGGFYPGGPMDLIAKAVGIESWPVRTSNPAMVVHLPSGRKFTRWTDERRTQERAEAFGEEGKKFWKWQESRADALWDLALRLPPWPPQNLRQIGQLLQRSGGWLKDDFFRRLNPSLFLDGLRPVAAHLSPNNEDLRLLVDAQLLIAAQTTSKHANALYGASALDLPRRGVVHIQGGLGGIAQTIAQAFRDQGGTLHYRKEVAHIHQKDGKPVAVETTRGENFPADLVVANLPPWNIAKLLGKKAPRKLRRLTHQPHDGWGAFMAYVGVDESMIPSDFPLHHQVIRAEPMGETNTVFLSFSPSWDKQRAPKGHRALTISTHTALAPWWDLFENQRDAYEERKQSYAESMLEVAETALPGLRSAARLVKPGTPVTFRRFTRREWGWVGGFPQTNLFRAWAPQLAPGLWMVGDSIFPGQSTAAVAMGGLRVAHQITAQWGANSPLFAAQKILPEPTKPL